MDNNENIVPIKLIMKKGEQAREVLLAIEAWWANITPEERWEVREAGGTLIDRINPKVIMDDQGGAAPACQSCRKRGECGLDTAAVTHGVIPCQYHNEIRGPAMAQARKEGGNPYPNP